MCFYVFETPHNIRLHLLINVFCFKTVVVQTAPSVFFNVLR